MGPRCGSSDFCLTLLARLISVRRMDTSLRVSAPPTFVTVTMELVSRSVAWTAFSSTEILVCDWMANNAGCVDRQFFATCDNEMKVYFDGELQEQDDAMGDWRKTSELTIPAGTRVVAIECEDVGAQEGILASTDDGLVTNSVWQCSDQLVEGWTLPGFVPPPDTFSSPNVLGSNGVAPWRVRPGIVEDAEWIWPQGSSTWAACRIQL